MVKNLSVVHSALFSWWREYGRVLPWREKGSSKYQVASSKEQAKSKKLPSSITQPISVRETVFQTYFSTELLRDPYRVVVSEVMLQQTQVDRVIPKYEGWMEQWPTIQDLAQAKLSDVLIAWQGLGYNRRARYLWLLAREIVTAHEGVWPETEKELIKLPGVGKYTARALLSFAFGKQVGVVDTNVKRVLGRWKGFVSDDASLTDKRWFELADSFLPTSQADPWNQALMDFGALVCSQRNPKCKGCPVAKYCQANVWARKKGFENYNDYRTEHPTNHARASRSLDVLPSKEGRERYTRKDAGLKFEETDRFFRGRIIDNVREQSWSVQLLQKNMEQKFRLDDQQRFRKLLERLENEGLIVVNNGSVMLADL